MRTSLYVCLCGGILAAAAAAQRVAAYDPFGSTIAELQPPTALLPLPNPPLIVFPTVPALPPPGPSTPTPGDSTFDNRIGLHWFTNGLVLAAMPTPAYPPLGPVPPPIFIPGPILGLLGGPVTGIALDASPITGVAPIMYLVSGPGIVVGVTPVPGLPVVVPPFPIPFLPAPTVVGLEWDGATGTLWAVDLAATLYNFFPGGAPAGPPVPAIFPLPAPPGDVAIDKIGTLNPIGLRPLYLTAAGRVVDARDPAAIPFPSGPPAEGLAWMNHPAEIPPTIAGVPTCEGCPGVTAGPTAFTTSVMSTGNAVFSAGMGGLQPLVGFGIFAFDATTGPVPFPPTATCPLGLTLSPTLILAIGGPADAAGNAYLAIPLGGVPVGVYLHNQNFTFCPTTVDGFAFSRFQTITVGGF